METAGFHLHWIALTFGILGFITFSMSLSFATDFHWDGSRWRMPVSGFLLSGVNVVTGFISDWPHYHTAIIILASVDLVGFTIFVYHLVKALIYMRAKYRWLDRLKKHYGITSENGG